MGKLKNAIDDVNNSRSMAGDNFDITDIDYREKNGKKYLDIEVQAEKLKKAIYMVSQLNLILNQIQVMQRFILKNYKRQT